VREGISPGQYLEVGYFPCLKINNCFCFVKGHCQDLQEAIKGARKHMFSPIAIGTL
jgi:hypothetical protein